MDEIIIDPRISDISASIWVAASAGSGKTKSLIDRILALLLHGVHPKKILCLTYTKAAAGEMSQRLSNIIHDLYLQKLYASGVSRSTINKLYEQSVSNNEWVSIQTIHSFCVSLLQQCYVESGLPANIKICDDQQKEQLLKQAIFYAINNPDNSDDLRIIATQIKNLSDIIDNDYNLDQIFDFVDNCSNLQKTYELEFNVPLLKESEQEILESLAIKFLGNAYRKEFIRIAKILHNSSKQKDQNMAQKLEDQAQNITLDICSIFLTKNGEIPKNICTQEVGEVAKKKLDDWTRNALSMKQEMSRLFIIKRSTAFFKICKSIAQKFRELKLQNNYIDFHDAIKNAIDLLQNFAWVAYKIDNNIEHVLVDEAQDTNPDQWKVIKLITQEFFINAGSSKTIFIVGDEKQSIFSFQGADVKYFAKMHDYFKSAALACGQNFYDIDLNKSYRTTGNILQYIDNVFCNIFPGIKHDTARDKYSGEFRVFELIENDQENLSKRELCTNIVNIIANAVNNKLYIPSKQRSALPSDFLILLQSRQNLMMPLISALQQANIPTAPPDKVKINDELIIEDLIYLAKFALLPTNDLLCAQVLKSPFVGISEEELMRLCMSRGHENLFSFCSKQDKYTKHILQLKQYINRAHYLPYDFFSYVLQNFKLRTQLDIDIVDTFLDIALNFQNNESQNLQNFVNWCRENTMHMTCNIDATNSGVKIMTAHKSKGLQAPFVILADSHFVSNHAPKILQTSSGICIWNTDNLAKNAFPELTEQYKQNRINESNRLLYVAMTRAEDFLYVLGIKQKQQNRDHWHNTIINNAKCIVEKFEPSPDMYRIQPENSPSISIPEFCALPLPHVKECQKETIDIIFGNCVHELLSKTAEEFEYMADDIVDKFDLPIILKQSAKEEAHSVMQRFSHLFTEHVFSEFEVIYQHDLLRIDKMYIDRDTIYIIDFKTGAKTQNCDQQYHEQLIRYRNAIGSIHQYTGYDIVPAILWTKYLTLEVVHDSYIE